MHPAVDVVIAGHSHSLLNLRVEGKLVVEALSYGVAYDLVDLTIDRSSGHVVHSSAEVPRTGHAGAVPDPELSALVEAHRARVGPLAERVVGDLPGRLGWADGDLAAVVAQAQRDRAGADLALVSPASLRADLDAGPVSYEEVFAAQAYDHPLLEMELSGTDLIDIVGASRRGGVRVTPLPSIEAGRKYAVVASELLVDRLGGLRQRALSVRPAGSEVEALADYIARRFPR